MPLRIALLQTSGRPGGVPENLEVLGAAAARAAAGGARLLICPEMFLTGYALGDELPGFAEPADGASAETVARIAEQHGITVVYGYPEQDGERTFNSVQLVGPDGTRQANYRKTHLFGFFEHEWFTPGDQPVVQVEHAGLRLGLMICYDVEFPENVRAHALAGTDLLLVPTAQVHPFQFVPESLVPVRAFENQMYIAYVNRTGLEGEYDFLGLSCLAGPDGAVRARAGRGEELILADVDLALLASSREANPYLQDRRPAMYSALS